MSSTDKYSYQSLSDLNRRCRSFTLNLFQGASAVVEVGFTYPRASIPAPQSTTCVRVGSRLKASSILSSIQRVRMATTG